MKTFKEILREQLLVDGDIDVYNLNLVGLPYTVTEEGDEDGLDFENWSITEINEYTMIMYCGGDWQEPMKLIIGLADNQLKVVDYERNMFEDGMSDEEIIKKLQ